MAMNHTLLPFIYLGMGGTAEKKLTWSGEVAHTCNPSTLGGQGGWITSAQEFETSLGNMAKPRLYKKYKNWELNKNFFLRQSFAVVTQAGVQWHDLS